MRLYIVIAAASLAACTDPASNVTNDVTNGQAAAVADVTTQSEEPNMSQPVNMNGPQPPNSGSGQRLETPEERDGLVPRLDEADQCGARDYQYLVGQPRALIPEKPAGATWRVTCTNCPVTMDYSPARLNIFYDEESGIVEEVRCG